MKKKKEFTTVARFRIFELTDAGDLVVPMHKYEDTPTAVFPSWHIFETVEEAEKALVQAAKDSDGWDVGVGTEYVILRTLEIRTTI